MTDEKKAAEEGSEKSTEKKPPAKKRAPRKRPPKKEEPVAGGPREPGDLNPVDLYREFIEQRTGGGAPPTREAYDEALTQWRKLPGSVIGVARDVKSVTETPEDQPSDSDDDSSQEEQKS